MIRELRNVKRLTGTCSLLGVLLLFAHLSLLLHDVAPEHADEEGHCALCVALDRSDITAFDAGSVAPLVPRPSISQGEQSAAFAVHSFVAVTARGPPHLV